MESKLSIEKAKNALFSGDAILTFSNPDLSKHFTYRISRKVPKDINGKKIKLTPEQEATQPLRVYLMDTPSNMKIKTYIGSIVPFAGHKFYQPATPDDFKKNRVTPETTSFKTFDYIYRCIMNGIDNGKFIIQHENRCCRCHKKLTHPDTVEAGIGRDCQKIVNQVIYFNKNKSKLNSIKK